MAFHRGGGGHLGTDQVSAPAGALPALEIAIGSGGAALAGLEAIGIHAQAHRTSRLAPLEPCVDEYAVETLFLRLPFDQSRTRHHERELHVRGLAAATHDGCR